MNKQKPVAKVTHNHEFGGGNHFNIQWLQPGAMRAGMELYSEPVPEAMSVPDGCAVINRTLTPEAWKRLCSADIWPVTPKSFQRMLDVLMDVAISNSPEFDGIKMVELHQIKTPDCRTCANRGRVDGLSQETHCEPCCHQPSIGMTSHYAPISESILALNEADSSESAPEGMILMPMKADEALVAGFVGCETREEALLGWDVAVRMQEVRTGKRKPADPAPYYEAEVIRLQKELDETRDELGKVRDRIADRIKDIESPFEVKNPTCPACGDGTESLCNHEDCPAGRFRGYDPMNRLIAADPKMKNPNCPREPIAKCVSGFCVNEKAGREKCEADSLLAGRPSRAKNLSNGAK